MTDFKGIDIPGRVNFTNLHPLRSLIDLESRHPSSSITDHRLLKGFPLPGPSNLTLPSYRIVLEFLSYQRSVEWMFHPGLPKE